LYALRVVPFSAVNARFPTLIARLRMVHALGREYTPFTFSS
jgi:hypothetical protein